MHTVGFRYNRPYVISDNSVLTETVSDGDTVMVRGSLTLDLGVCHRMGELP